MNQPTITGWPFVIKSLEVHVLCRPTALSGSIHFIFEVVILVQPTSQARTPVCDMSNILKTFIFPFRLAEFKVRPRLRWEDDVRNGLRKIGVKNWKQRAQERKQWKEIIEQAKTHKEL
jgi:hypothetical protein